MTTLTQSEGTTFQHCIPPKGLPPLLNMHLRAETDTFLTAFRHGASEYLSVYEKCPHEQSGFTMKLKQVSVVDSFTRQDRRLWALKPPSSALLTGKLFKNVLTIQ